MIKAYKFRLYPNKEQIKALKQQLDAHRWLYNYALAERKEVYEKNNRSISYEEQAYSLPKVRAKNPYLAQCNCSSLQQTLRRLDKTFRAFFRRIKAGEKAGYPRFKPSFRFNTLQYAKLGNGCQVKNKKLYLQNVGEIKVKWHREIEGKIKTLSITRRINKWYIVFAVETNPKPLPVHGSIIGIDMGLTNFVTTSEGKQVKYPKCLVISEKQLVKAQKKLSRRKKGSKRRTKARYLLTGIHEKIKTQRLDFVHKLTHNLIQKHSGFVVENLNIKNMVKNHCFAKSIHDASWGLFLTVLKNKAESAGFLYEKVDPKNTSQICSACGKIVRKSLAVRVHKCTYCNFVVDRDVNAAINILNRARTEPSVLAITR